MLFVRKVLKSSFFPKKNRTLPNRCNALYLALSIGIWRGFLHIKTYQIFTKIIMFESSVYFQWVWTKSKIPCFFAASRGFHPNFATQSRQAQKPTELLELYELTLQFKHLPRF